MKFMAPRQLDNPFIVEHTYADRLREQLLDHALTYAEQFGFSVVPVAGKLATVKWKQFQTRWPTREEIVGWQWDGLGIITGAVSNIVVVDCDTLEVARWFWRERATSPTVVRTRRGIHLYFQHPGGHVKNCVKAFDKYDIRGDGGLIVAPPSPNRTWLAGHGLRHAEELPLFRAEWLPVKVAAAQRTAQQKDIACPEAYISTIRAVAGQGGHDQTYKAACYLRDAGLSKLEATLIMARWNLTNAEPVWSDTELAHKLDDAFGE